MLIVNNYINLHKQIIKLINECNDTLYFVSFHLDIEYVIYNSLINALNRNIKIYIITSGLSPYNFIKHKNCVIKNNVNIRDKNDDNILFLKKIFNIQVGNQYRFVNHLRFIYNGEKLLFGGTNVSSRYNGSQFNIIKNNNFTWYDSGLLMKLQNQNSFFYNLFKKITTGKIKNIINKDLICNKGVKLTFSNKSQYKYIIKTLFQNIYFHINILLKVLNNQRIQYILKINIFFLVNHILIT